MAPLVVGISSAKGRPKTDAIWDLFAYGGRYGMQPLDNLRSMTIAELEMFASKVSSIVKDENRPRKEDW